MQRNTHCSGLIKGLVVVITLPPDLYYNSVTQGHSYRLLIPSSRINCLLSGTDKTLAIMYVAIVKINSLEEFNRQITIQINQL